MIWNNSPATLQPPWRQTSNSSLSKLRSFSLGPRAPRPSPSPRKSPSRKRGAFSCLEKYTWRLTDRFCRHLLLSKPALTGVVMEVKQQHVGHKTNHKPNCRFDYSLELWGHERRIPS